MLKRLVVSALLAGLAAGLALAALQQVFTVPVIMEAELYESGALTHFDGVAGGAAHRHGEETGAPARDHSTHDHVAHDHSAPDHGFDVGRAATTVLMTVLTMAGFGLMLVAGFALAERLGLARIDARAGLLWGLAGFLAVHAATSLGLPPELPGSAAADLGARQAWWALAAICSAAGLAALAYGGALARLGGVVLLALPHLVGAPHPDALGGVAPPELSALFAARVLAVSAVAWLVLGWVAGRLWASESA